MKSEEVWEKNLRFFFDYVPTGTIHAPIRCNS